MPEMRTWPLSRYLPPTIPVFFLTGSITASESSDRKHDSTNDRDLQVL